MPTLKKIRRLISLLLITIFLGVFINTAQADFWGDVGAEVNNLFDLNKDGLSFTQYEGQLAALSEKGYDPSIVQAKDLREYVVTIVNFALKFLGLAAVVVVIYGGVLYVTAAGEEDRAGTGKKAITYATIGLIIVLGSFAFVNTVIKGAGGEQAGGGGASVGTTTGAFNAVSENIRVLAINTARDFAALVESTEDLKNIRNDAQKTSLLPENLPDRGAIISFLQTTKNRLNTVKSRTQPYTTAESIINELLREIDQDMDVIENLSRKTYMSIDNGREKTCDPDEVRDFGEGLLGDTDQEICASRGAPNYYIAGLYNNWLDVHKKYAAANNDAALYNLSKPMGQDFAARLEITKTQLEQIFNNYQNISQAIEKARLAYTTMQSAYDSVLADMRDWNLDSNITTTGGNFMEALRNQSILFFELDNLQFVKAQLKADFVEGAAPLPVTFDILGSQDPAGGSVRGENITWDLGGTLNTADLMSAPPGQTLQPLDESVTCNFVSASGEDFIGNTSKRCIFHKTGTYRAAIKIHSNDPTKYAPGISILQVKVNPPTTEINLLMESSGRSQIINRYENGQLKVDRHTVNITRDDAQNGLRFDATETKAAQYKWDFGNGKITPFSNSSSMENKYENAGTYEVRLDVLNAAGTPDKKIFTLNVSAIAAHIKANSPGGAFINQPVTFDAGDSKSDLGKIANYSWTIAPTPGQDIPFDIRQELERNYPFTDSGSNLPTLTHEFKFPLDYDITVKVTDNARNEGEYKLQNYLIESKPPVAAFQYKIPDTSQPGTVHFDGTVSYDPDGTRDFEYQWSIAPENDWQLVEKENSSLTSPGPIIQFTEKGDYEVTLKVTDEIAADEFHETVQTVTAGNVLDVGFAPEQLTTFVVDENGQAKVDFLIQSANAIAYEVDFGDGEKENGDIGTAPSHIYKQAGKYLVNLTVYNKEDDENSVQRRLFVGGGNTPVAKATLLVNGAEIDDLRLPVAVSKKDVLTFDAGESKNSDGTGRDLKYFWDFGDTKISSNKRATHSYKDLSPKDPGYYVAKLKIVDKDNSTKSDTDEVRINVVNMPPRFSSVQGVPQLPSNLVTPVIMSMKAYGQEDPDGQIVQYRWWYFDLDDPDEPLGLQITNTPTAQLTIGTRGQEGREVTYGFGLEVTDSDGLTYSNSQAIEEGQTATIQVVNGPNEMPQAEFRPDSTTVFAGDKVNFSSSSKDPDGQIMAYIWDVEGDGFHNNAPTDKATIQHIYEAKNLDGYEVRLKVVDDKGGEDVSDPIRIFVDSLAAAPVAAFGHEVIAGSQGMQVKFTNNSTADESSGAKILFYKWDFDADTDSNGDGLKNNDVDSQTKDPENTYLAPGEYNVKLTVIDNQGNKDDVTNAIKIPLANPPKAAFLSEIIDNQVVFKNNSTADTAAGATLKEYTWDFDTASNFVTADKDGDGVKDNDADSLLKDPVHKYAESGTYKVKLAVTDTQNNTDEVVQDVQFVAAISGLPGNAPSQPQITAILKTEPVPSADGVVYLSGEKGTVKFDPSLSLGPVAYYIYDKNIYFDSDGNGNPADDENYKTVFNGTYTTNFEKVWGRIVARLKVVDIYGNENTTTVEIKFK